MVTTFKINKDVIKLTVNRSRRKPTAKQSIKFFEFKDYIKQHRTTIHIECSLLTSS